MCGIVGWVDFARDLRQEAATVRAMTATMALRGPDAEGIWLDRNVGLGHRRLAVIDLAHGAQPMTVERDGKVVATITYSGEVYNFAELREELRGHGHRFRTTSDTEVVLNAYLQWGESFVDHLIGMFAFGLWDAVEHRLLLVRDRLGVKPLYYRPTPDGVMFASELKGILAHPAAPAEVDSEGLRELMSFAGTPGHGIYRGVYEVLPGELIRVDDRGLRRRRYWQLTTVEHEDDLPTTIRTVRGLLEEITAQQLVADVPLCVLLSGGLDSSALTALAQHVSGGAGALRTFAVDFVGQADNFHSDDLRSAHDMPFVRDMVAHTGTVHTDIVLSAGDLMDSINRSRTFVAGDLPSAFGDMTVSLYLLFRAVREHSTVALSGESADEVFGGYRWFHDPALVNAGTFPWMAALNPSDEGGSQSSMSLFEPGLTKSLDLVGYRDAAYRQALAEVEHLPGADATERRMREISYLNLTRFLRGMLDRKDRTSMANGLEVRVPFCDHRLVQYMYNVPWAMKTFDGREKSLLRAAVADLLPASVLERRKSAYPTVQDPAYDPALRVRLNEALDDRDSPLLPLLDTGMTRMLGSFAYEETELATIARRGVELVLSLDEWLRRNPVRIILD
ncbi:asparagine synthase (glutamine-hydrolyzing) [Streptosporangium sp. 'caverna']|uniref:asparagine synthase (glutamine-hydrolyzing) n=1 Tax=Streptosporangium sp. 'caverna' TaxID=2202249 RepID=UPI000D7D9691|nr:asparagine synthase (glutamine-hydrolyzing) [Streptosporangium sp. 'caverna']AWS44332.1 asparagine synthase (glutamine-hydrolyzing) [Streptosporangium sp. 'caverna']